MAPDRSYPALPKPGVIDAFDAGWNAHEVGLSRASVDLFSPTPFARAWALLGYDCRKLQAEKEGDRG